MKTVKYTCPRCGYECIKKHRMEDHLYKRKKECCGSENDIVLTDEIKKKIMENKKYKIPVIKEQKVIKVKAKPTIDINEGCIYVFYTRASKNADEPVYKIGKTGDYKRRILQYTKGGDMLFVLKVKNRHDAEILIKDGFKQEFIQRRDYGHEYFEGDIYEMILLMKDILEDQIEDIVVNFSCKAITL